ncbi:MAG: DNA translocase FtsK [Ignavibacteriales bacterium]
MANPVDGKRQRKARMSRASREVAPLREFLGKVQRDLKYEAAGLALVGLGVLLVMSFLGEASGIVSDALVRSCRVLLGDMAPLIPAGPAALGVFIMVRRRLPPFTPRTAGAIVAVLDAALVLHSSIEPGTEYVNAGRGYGGGVIGAVLAVLLRKGFGQSGLWVAAVIAGVVAVSLVANASPGKIAGAVVKGIRLCVTSLKRSMEDFFYEAADLSDEGEAACTVGDAVEKAPAVAPAAVQTGGGQPPCVDAAAETRPGDGAGVVIPLSRASRRASRQARATGGEGGAAAPEQLTLSTHGPYEIPPLSLLDRQQGRPKALRPDRDIEDRAKTLEETLQSFGVQAKVVQVSRGPAVTRFELQPGPGVKVASITSLANDIALNLAAQDVRIEAPIPGKSAVGIEVPNTEVTLVHLRDVLDTKEFKESPSNLTVALGKDIAGRPIVSTLEKMLHVLIAGATGSGKSVCINSIITSILFKSKPDEVKMLLVDPKMVELSVYDGIPHLVAPVVTDPKKAAGALRWVVREMEKRYQTFVSAGVRDIAKYNQAAAALGEERLPFIVVVIDELSDLMMVAPVDVEDAIFRLAQMARASGIHLVVATQRPSVDVVTGTIKANIPSRIAFTVSSQIDSRTILDAAGAEKLVGKGDMLFFPVGATKAVRAQGAYINEREVERVVNFVREQGGPRYEEIVTEPEQESGNRQEGADDLFPQAVKIVVEAGQASVSLLQRKLPIGYARAARLIDAMEERGFVGPYEGSKPREVRLTFQEYQRIFGQDGV